MNFDKEMVQTILLGQENLDRMRAEISHLISMLIGMVDSHQKNLLLEGELVLFMQVSGEIVRLKDGQCFWKIEVHRERKDLGVWFVFESELVYIFEGKWQNPKYVEVVYGQLPKLLELFVRTFPHLVERLEPFVKAAEVKF